MVGTPPSAKRMKSRGVKSTGKLEGWFSGDATLINKYLLEISRKNVNTQKNGLFHLDEIAKAGFCEKHSQGVKTEKILRAHWEYISRFGEGILH